MIYFAKFSGYFWENSAMLFFRKVTTLDWVRIFFVCYLFLSISQWSSMECLILENVLFQQSELIVYSSVFESMHYAMSCHVLHCGE